MTLATLAPDRCGVGAHPPAAGDARCDHSLPSGRRVTAPAMPAGPAGLCADHAAERAALRATVASRPVAPAPARGLDALADALAAIVAARAEPWRARAAWRGRTDVMVPAAVLGPRGRLLPLDYSAALALCATCLASRPSSRRPTPARRWPATSWPAKSGGGLAGP